MGEILKVRNAYRMEQWRQIIQECQKSGLSNKAYCEQQGISEKRYYYWLRKLRTAAVEQVTPQIMELEPEDERRGEVLYIRYRGAELTLRGVPVAEDSGRTAAAGRAQFPVADGGAEDRPAKGNPKRESKGPVLREKLYIQRGLWYNILIDQRETVVFAVGKKSSSVQADAAVFSQLREENAALKQEVEELRRKLERMNELQLDAQRACSACGHPLKQIGKKYLYDELEIIPQQVHVIKYYSATYACENCEKESGYAHIYSIKAPPRLLKHSLASASTVASVMTRKYVDGLPLYRQEKIWAREGVAQSRATMANWVIQTARTWLKPLYRRLKKHLLESRVIYADETVVQVLKEDGKPASSESRMWVYGSGERGGRPIRFFEYQPGRSGKYATAFLKGFTGCLVTDAYPGYNQVTGAVRCGCWAHMRRKWREAMPKGATTATSKAAIGYEYCNKLFALEKKFTEMSDDVRKTARQVKAESLLEAYWLRVENLDPVPGSKLAEAVTYAQNQRAYLSAFLIYGEVDISNNFAENAIRPFAVGRKNWLFSDTSKGAESSAIVYTLVETAKANGLNPYAYLLQLLTELPYLGRNPGQDALDMFLPWKPAVRAACTSAPSSRPSGDLC